MNVQKSKIIVLLAAVMLLVTSGCRPEFSQARIGELQTRTEAVELDNAQSKRVEINMAIGELKVSGGASKLMQAEYTYNVAELDPQMAYRGNALIVNTPDASASDAFLRDLEDFRYEWDLQLNDNVPLNLSVEMGPGNADLKLGSLSLTRLDLDIAAGTAAVDLSGDWRNDLDANIHGGLGTIAVRLPRSTCARVTIDGGIGRLKAKGLSVDGEAYVNDACASPGTTLRIAIDAGVGQVQLDVAEQ